MRLRWWVGSTVLAVLGAVAVMAVAVLLVGPPGPGLPGIFGSAGQSSATTPPAPHQLALTSHPAGATARITGGDGKVITAETPYDGDVTGGRITIELTRAGSNPLRTELDLDADREVQLWLDPEGSLHHKLGELKTEAAPNSIAFSPDGRELWVSLLGAPGIEVFDTATQQRLGSVDLGERGAVEAVFSKDGTTVYASQIGRAAVYAIDRETRKVRRTIQTGGAGARGLAVSPDGGTLFVANWESDDISQVDLASGRLARRIPTVGRPRGVYPSPDGKRLFVAGYRRGQLDVIDLATGEGAVVTRTDGAFREVLADRAGARLYALDEGTDSAWILDAAGGRGRRLAATDTRPTTADLSPDGRVLYVASKGEAGSSEDEPGPEWGSVLALDASTGKPLDAIVGGDQTAGLDVSPDGKRLAFTDFLDDRVQLYEVPATDRLLTGGGGRYRASRLEIAK